MIWNEKEEQFLRDNKELVNQGAEGWPVLFEKLYDEYYHSMRGIRKDLMELSLIYSTLGPEVFRLWICLETNNPPIEDVLFSETGVHCKSISMLPELSPRLFKNNTKVKFYKLNDFLEIEEAEKGVLSSNLSSKEKLLNFIKNRGFNLVTLDTPRAKESIVNNLNKASFVVHYKLGVKHMVNERPPYLRLYQNSFLEQMYVFKLNLPISGIGRPKTLRELVLDETIKALSERFNLEGTNIIRNIVENCPIDYRK